MKSVLLAVLAALLLAGCGGGGGADPAQAVRLMLDQVGECFSVAAGRATPDQFNAAAAEIASVPEAQVCAAWPAGVSIPCSRAYAIYSKPYKAGACT